MAFLAADVNCRHQPCQPSPGAGPCVANWKTLIWSSTAGRRKLPNVTESAGYQEKFREIQLVTFCQIVCCKWKWWPCNNWLVTWPLDFQREISCTLLRQLQQLVYLKEWLYISAAVSEERKRWWFVLSWPWALAGLTSQWIRSFPIACPYFRYFKRGGNSLVANPRRGWKFSLRFKRRDWEAGPLQTVGTYDKTQSYKKYIGCNECEMLRGSWK